MRFATFAAVASLGLSTSANALIQVRIHADATGTTIRRVFCPDGSFNCMETTPAARTFDLGVNIPDFVNGQSYWNFVGASGDVTFRDGQLTGTNFNFYESSQSRETHLQAATYGVFPVGEGLVPEPATWAFMLTGFGLVGYSMRRRQVAWTLIS